MTDDDPPNEEPYEREDPMAASPLDDVDLGEPDEDVDPDSQPPPPFQGDSDDGVRADSRSEALRLRLGLSGEQWDLLVSVAIFLPYPIFVALIVTGTLDGLLFLLLTLAYSILAIVANFYL